MSRWDITGLFWDDYVAPKVAAEKVKREPPDPVWLADDYLPHYELAKPFKLPEMTDAEVMDCAGKKLPWDTEFYGNYSLLGCMEPESGKVASFEWSPSFECWLADLEKLAWILRNCTMVGFNDNAFDIPMIHAVLNGLNPEQLMRAVEHLIHGEDGRGTRPYQFYKDFKLKTFPIDNIDLIGLTPLGPSLKVCAGRLHTTRMADLPFKPGITLSPKQIQVLRWYWYNDLRNTKLLWDSHKTAIELREHMTAEYGVDVRSKSDPQVAEAVIRTEIQRITGRNYIAQAKIIPWRSFQYVPPAYIQYESPTMQWVLEFVRRQVFVIDEGGQPIMPNELASMDVRIGNGVYRIGMGGLHSQEKRVTHVAGDEYEIRDSDVTSYYPSMMIQQGMYPPNVGPEFLTVFKRIVDRRVSAKQAGDKATAETLKIVANGTFGKTGERHGRSVVYYPEMMIQVTVTGQLSLLLLIERLELAGIEVISANTDGMIVKCRLDQRDLRNAIMAQWEKDTGLNLEHKVYKAVYSRDVNNYIALYDKPDAKDQSPFRHGKAVGAYRKTIDVYPLKWNPTCEICNEALIEYLATGRPMEETIRACTDIRKFLEMRLVRGGACKDGEYLGKAIRWYYSTEMVGEIIVANNGYSVPKSTGARPCMDLPEGIPPDLNYPYYVERAIALLDDFQPKKPKKASEPVASEAA